VDGVDTAGPLVSAVSKAKCFKCRYR
jgi:hypothetical protein